MKILSVYAHPTPASFTRALLDAFADGARSCGHAVDVIDLYRDAFDPVFGAEDLAQFEAGHQPSLEIAQYQRKVQDADALVFAFPIWWWSMPAILKGWLDRVFSFGFAYGEAEDGSTGLLQDRPVILLTPGLTAPATVAKYGYENAFRQTTAVGLFQYCGLMDVRWHLFSDVGSEQARQRHLIQARVAGAAM